MAPERICLYAGSFDPITLGHMDIIERAANVFDRVLVAVASNPGKQCAFSLDDRMYMIRQATAHMKRVKVTSCRGLTVAFAREQGASVLIRGLRAVSDFEGERGLAQINRAIAPDVETLFLIGKPEHSHISSSAVREMAGYGCDLTGFVPEGLEEMIRAHFEHEKGKRSTLD